MGNLICYHLFKNYILGIQNLCILSWYLAKLLDNPYVELHKSCLHLDNTSCSTNLKVNSILPSADGVLYIAFLSSVASPFALLSRLKIFRNSLMSLSFLSIPTFSQLPKFTDSTYEIALEIAFFFLSVIFVVYLDYCTILISLSDLLFLSQSILHTPSRAVFLKLSIIHVTEKLWWSRLCIKYVETPQHGSIWLFTAQSQSIFLSSFSVIFIFIPYS